MCGEAACMLLCLRWIKSINLPHGKRDEFNRMIADCRAGKIDMIITKSISRFARNTLDCLNYVRELKELGIGIIFENFAFLFS